jgi:uncharacterized protein YbgA (DUF1722 family)
MISFSESFLSSLNTLEGFILKSRSPSCGIKDVRIYPKAEKSPAIGRGPGFFGERVLNRFSGLAIEDEGRLMSLKIREYFLTKLFALARFRQVKTSAEIHDVSQYHAKNKFLFMAYNQNEMRSLGNIAANHEKKPFPQIAEEYEEHLRRSMRGPPKRTSNINVLMHILGFFSKELSKDEKQFFLQTVATYGEGRIPLASPLRLAKSWAVRFQNKYLLNQTFFDPYPSNLIEWSDAGRTIEL